MPLTSLWLKCSWDAPIGSSFSNILLCSDWEGLKSVTYLCTEQCIDILSCSNDSLLYSSFTILYLSPCEKENFEVYWHWPIILRGLFVQVAKASKRKKMLKNWVNSQNSLSGNFIICFMQLILKKRFSILFFFMMLFYVTCS